MNSVSNVLMNKLEDIRKELREIATEMEVLEEKFEKYKKMLELRKRNEISLRQQYKEIEDFIDKQFNEEK